MFNKTYPGRNFGTLGFRITVFIEPKLLFQAIFDRVFDTNLGKQRHSGSLTGKFQLSHSHCLVNLDLRKSGNQRLIIKVCNWLMGKVFIKHGCLWLDLQASKYISKMRLYSLI